MTNNKKVLQFVSDVEAFAQPDKVVWIDGSDCQRDALREEACATGEIVKLNQEKLPDCYYHRTAENDVARVEDRTFICCENEADALPHSIVKWKAPKEAYAMVNEIAKGAYKGRTMYVIPCMRPLQFRLPLHKRLWVLSILRWNEEVRLLRFHSK